MKHIIIGMALLLTVSATVHAGLVYTFDTDVEGFQNVSWKATAPAGWSGIPTVQQTHTAGGWQMVNTKEFSWGPGGGSANQQLEMQALANSPAARIAFDVMVNGNSFPPGVAAWFQFNVVGNSDGSAGWTQRENLFTISGWHNADDPALVTMHIDQPFSFFGWQPGDTWFQLWTGSNSDGAVPVNFYLDNVILTPEPASLALLGLSTLVLMRRRRVA